MLNIVHMAGPPISWHVGEKKTDVSPLYVTYIQADGDELDRIESIFCPSTHRISITWAINQRVHRWYGSEAKTILWGLFNAK